MALGTQCARSEGGVERLICSLGVLPGWLIVLLVVGRGDAEQPRPIHCKGRPRDNQNMREVTHPTVLNKISDDEERKIAIM